MSAPASQPTTIAAVATPTGVGAVSLVRVSGPLAIAVADLATAGRASLMSPRTATRCRILDTAGNVLDDGLMLVFKAPNSFTGEAC
ncbi:MAG: tRNA uridine-5-carboxymethylaminomethyl(34) synthesis GTPase MnmE, partial [Verrucomicrobiota bacterium]